jgi:hypothetical protein
MKILRAALIIASVEIIAFTLFIALKGNITNSSLSEELAEQNELLADAQEEALTYGITVDDDSDLVMPVSEESQSEAEFDWDYINTRNEALLQSFAECILTFNGNIASFTTKLQHTGGFFHGAASDPFFSDQRKGFII